MLCAGAVVGAVDKGLCIARNPVKPLQMFAVRIEILRFMIVAIFQRFAVASKPVCLNHSSKSNILCDKLGHGRDLNIVGYFHFQISRIPFFVFGHRNKNALISRFSSANTLNFRSKVGIIEFHDPAKHIVFVTHFHSGTDTPQKMPGGLIAHLDFICQGQRGDASFVTGHQIDRPEPFMEGQMTAVHDCASGERGLVTALGTLETAVTTDGIAMPVTTDRAFKPVGPLDLVKILEAGFLIGKAFDKLVET